MVPERLRTVGPGGQSLSISSVWNYRKLREWSMRQDLERSGLENDSANFCILLLSCYIHLWRYLLGSDLQKKIKRSSCWASRKNSSEMVAPLSCNRSCIPPLGNQKQWNRNAIPIKLGAMWSSSELDLNGTMPWHHVQLSHSFLSAIARPAELATVQRCNGATVQPRDGHRENGSSTGRPVQLPRVRHLSADCRAARPQGGSLINFWGWAPLLPISPDLVGIFIILGSLAPPRPQNPWSLNELNERKLRKTIQKSDSSCRRAFVRSRNSAGSISWWWTLIQLRLPHSVFLKSIELLETASVYYTLW